MAVDNIVLPDLAYNQGKGWTARRCFSNDITVLRNQAEQRVQRSLTGWREYTVPFEYLRPNSAEILTWYSFLVARGGNARGFLLWDPTGGGMNAYASTPQNLGNGTGSQTAFQMTWTWADSVNPVTENVLHPVPTGTTIPVNLLGAIGWTSTNLTTTNVVKVNGVLKTEGTDYTINASTGVITFTVAPSSGQSVTWQGWRYIAVRLVEDHFEFDHHSIQSYATLTLKELPFE